MLRFQEEMDRQGKKQKKDKINDRLIGCAVMRKLSSVLMLYLVVKLKLLEKVLSFVSWSPEFRQLVKREFCCLQ